MSKLPEFWQTLSSLQQRTISAVLLGGFVLGAILCGGLFLAIIVALMAVLAYREYLPLVQKQWHKSWECMAYASLVAGCLTTGLSGDIILGFAPVLMGFVVLVILSHLYYNKADHKAPVWVYAGLFYVAVPALSILWLRQTGEHIVPETPWMLLLMPMLGVWATDTGAYFAGRRIGGPKIAPKISPNKTWAGLIGGMLAASLVMGGMAVCVQLAHAPFYFVFGAVMAIIAQMGDFFESHLKRRAGVKDSGHIIPGHGGILDRIDGVLTALPFFAIFVLILL